MADGVTLDPGSGGVTVATDDDGTFHWPYTKLVFGANNTQTIVGSTSSNPLPVALSDTDNAVLDAIAASVAGTLTVGSHAVTNAGTFAVQAVCTNAGTFATQAVCTNAGTFAVQVDGNALTALQLLDDTVFVDDAAFTATTSKVMMIGGQYQSSPNTLDDGDAGSILLDASHRIVLAPGSAEKTDDGTFTPGTTGVVMIGCQADETATDSVDEGDAGCPRMTLDRKQIVTTQPHTAGGCTPFYNLDVDETEDAIKASAGQLYELALINTTNALIYVKLYNATTANVTVGSTTPVMTIPVPGNNDTDGAGIVRNWPNGLAFGTAITIAATTSFADNDTGAPGTNALIASGAYI